MDGWQGVWFKVMWYLSSLWQRLRRQNWTALGLAALVYFPAAVIFYGGLYLFGVEIHQPLRFVIDVAAAFLLIRYFDLRYPRQESPNE